MNTINIRNILFLSSLAIIGLLVAIPNKIFAAGLLGAFVIAALILYYANIRSLNLHVHSEKSPPYVRVVAVVLAALVVGIIVFSSLFLNICYRNCLLFFFIVFIG